MERQSGGGRLLKIVTIAFAVIITVLIFLSKTIYNYNLPQVTGVMPFRGKLNKIEFARGVAVYAAEHEVYSDINCKIDAVLYKEGDMVEEGAAVFEVSFEGADTEITKQIAALEEEHRKRLLDLDIQNQRLLLEIERIEANIGNAARKMEEIEAQGYTPADISDRDILDCERDIEQTEKDLEEKTYLYEAGLIPRTDLDMLTRSLQTLRNRLIGLNKNRDDEIARQADAALELETNKQKQLKDYEFQQKTYAKDLEAKEIDKAAYTQQRQAYAKDYETRLKDLNEKLKTYDGAGVIYAPITSVITDIKAVKGKLISAGQTLAVFGDVSEYVVECEISMENNFVETGDRYKMSNVNQTVTGIVTKVALSENGMKSVVISLEDTDIAAGTTFDITFEKQSEESYMLIPNGAVGKDSDGYYLNQIKRREGILGNEYYTEKLRIYAGDSDSSNTAVTRGITFPEPVVLISDKPYTEGESVKIRNEGDFFAD